MVLGPPVAEWPQRVAVVAFGRHADYGQGHLIMADGTRPIGSMLRVSVAGPKDLARWAFTNRVRIPTYHRCCAVVKGMRRYFQPSQTTMQIRAAVWDLTEWLPHRSSEETGTGLSDDRCWHSVFRQLLFAKLFKEIIQHPAHVVMLALRMP